MDGENFFKFCACIKYRNRRCERGDRVACIEMKQVVRQITSVERLKYIIKGFLKLARKFFSSDKYILKHSRMV